MIMPRYLGQAAHAVCLIISACLLPLTSTAADTTQTALHFNFTQQPIANAINIKPQKTVPLFDAQRGYGFVAQTSAFPPREVHIKGISHDAKGVSISESEFYAEPKFEADNYNRFGMAFRIKAAPGAYDIQVKTTSDVADTTVSVSGMQSSRLLPSVFWDAAQLIPNKTSVTAQGRDWQYRYVNGRDFIDIEIEPNQINTPVGIAEITLTPVPVTERKADELPTIFTLGDSTVKSYTFDEAPMSGWGQVFDKLFDLSKVRVINYSIGGRSFKNAYSEGRFNDLLLAAKAGDYLLIQFGHNDEREDEFRRWGRGATEASYEALIRDVYLPAIRARGIIPAFVTPMSRVNGDAKPGDVYTNSFNKRLFPAVMKKQAAAAGITLVDLNTRSIDYYNQTGVAAIGAMVMSIEAGETPGKTNDGSYANGHPSKKIDGTHFKESLAKQYARIVVSELTQLGSQGDTTAAQIAAFLKSDVKNAITTNDWSAIYPEIAKDIQSGDNAYYRNQFEKLLQLGALQKDEKGNVYPQKIIKIPEFVAALRKVLQLTDNALADVEKSYGKSDLTRELMGAILADAYHAKFASKPKFMTDYNGKTAIPGSPGYDPNLDSGAQGAMYYPLVDWTQLTDTNKITSRYTAKVKDAYELGLIRSEIGITRGQMINGRALEPKTKVSRAKAAKALYFMWVLAQPVRAENDVIGAVL